MVGQQAGCSQNRGSSIRIEEGLKEARRKEYGKEKKESDDLQLYDSLGLDF